MNKNVVSTELKVNSHTPESSPAVRSSWNIHKRKVLFLLEISSETRDELFEVEVELNRVKYHGNV